MQTAVLCSQAIYNRYNPLITACMGSWYISQNINLLSKFSLNFDYITDVIMIDRFMVVNTISLFLKDGKNIESAIEIKEDIEAGCRVK